MTDVEAELRDQLTAAFEGADYPVNSPMDLLPALPDGPGTKFEAGDVSFTAMELGNQSGGGGGGGDGGFPYDSVDDLVDEIIEGLKNEDVI